MKAAKVDFNVVNNTTFVTNPLGGIVYVMGQTKRGPVNDPSELLNTWPAFEKLFGGLISASNFPLLVRRMLDRGVSVRVCRVDDGSAAKCNELLIPNTDDPEVSLFGLTPKYKGADYNNLDVYIFAATNGSSDYFNLEIRHAIDSNLDEVYENLPNPIVGAASAQSFLEDVISKSALVDVTYKVITVGDGLAPAVTATDAPLSFTGGVDPTAIDAADYIGDSATKVGLNAFDAFSDGDYLVIPDLDNELSVDEETVKIAAGAYAYNRDDIDYICHINATNTASAAVAEKATITGIDKQTILVGGGLVIADPLSGTNVEVSEAADVAANAAYVDNNFLPWLSSGGPNRGIIPNVLSVINNYGSPAKYSDLNTLANAGINMVIARDGRIMQWGNFTARLTPDMERFWNVRRLIKYIKKALRPTIESFIEDPNTFSRWKRIYYTVKPFFESLVEGEAIYAGWTWEGDQFATSLENLQVNNQDDVLQGKYKVKASFTPVNSMQVITIELVLTKAGVTIN